MMKVTEEERLAWQALELGLCPKCGKPLAVWSDNEDEDEEFAWFCVVCGVPGDPQRILQHGVIWLYRLQHTDTHK